jgi:hypothetical protein
VKLRISTDWAISIFTGNPTSQDDLGAIWKTFRMEESDISRVLFYGGKPPQGNYLSGMAVTDHLMQYLQEPKPLMRDWKKPNHTPTNLAPNRGLPSQHLSVLLVRSYRTFAPLPWGATTVGPYGGIFLWHYPHDRSHWALPSKFGLWGARTFLSNSRQNVNCRNCRTGSSTYRV